MKHSTLRVGIIGCGTLAKQVTEYLQNSRRRVEITGYLVSSRNVESRPNFVASIEAFVAQSHDVVVECASQNALLAYAQRVVSSGADLVPASIGAFADDEFLQQLLRDAERADASVRLPSGAIAGIDGLAAAKHIGIESVLYRGTMPRSSLEGYVAGHLPERGLIFAGTAREAVAKFPKNANLTGTVALTGIGFERTRVEMHVDSTLTNNLHELFVKGVFGEYSVRMFGTRISATSPSSRIVAGSLAQAALGSSFATI